MVTHVDTRFARRREIEFDTVADMVAASFMVVGQLVTTKEYFAGTGGGNRYKIVAAATGTDDGFLFIDLSGSGLQAEALFYNEEMNILQAGVTGVTDDTITIQAALDGASGKGILTAPTGTYITGRLAVPSNTHLICSPNTTFLTPAAGITDSGWWRFVDTDNVRIEANYATFEFQTKPSADENRHVFDMRGATDMYIGYSKAVKAGGDGYYVGSGTTDNPSEDVVLDHVFSDNCRRQGMSIVDVKRLHVINPSLKNTTGTSPAAGIDIEMNTNDDFCEDVVIDNPVTSGNDGNGIVVALVNLAGSVDKVVNITINNPSSKNDLNGIEIEKFFLDTNEVVTGRIIIDNPTADTPDRTCFRVRNYDSNGPRVDFYNPIAINPNEADDATTKDFSGYVVFKESGDAGATTIGNIHFHRPQCIDDRGVSGTDDTSSGAAFMTDTTAAFTTNEFVGDVITNTTDESTGIISANTATTVTATMSSGTWDSGDGYSIATPQVNDWFHFKDESGTDVVNCSLIDPQRIDGAAQGKETRIFGDVYVSDVNQLLVKQLNNVAYTAEPNDYFRTHNTDGTAMSGNRIVALDAAFDAPARQTFIYTGGGVHTYTIDPDGSSEIQPGSNGVGKNISTTDEGARITLERKSSTLWLVIEEIGTWAREA